MVLLLMATMGAPEMMVQLGVFSTIGMSIYVQSTALHIVAAVFTILATPISKRATNYGLRSYSPFVTFVYFAIDLFQALLLLGEPMLSANFVGVTFLQELGSLVNNTGVHRHAGLRCCFSFLRMRLWQHDFRHRSSPGRKRSANGSWRGSLSEEGSRALLMRLQKYDSYRNSDEVEHLMLRMLADSRGLLLAGIATGFMFAGDVVTQEVLGTSNSTTHCIYSCPVIGADKKRHLIPEGRAETLCKMLVVVPCIRLAFFQIKRWGVRKIAAAAACDVFRKVRCFECFEVPKPVGLFVFGYATIAITSVWAALMLNYGK